MSHERTLQVALIQRGPAGMDLDANLTENLRLIDEAAAGSPDFICLNELSTTPYFPRNPGVDHVPWALPLASEAIAEVAERARRLNCHIVYPFYELIPETGKRLNSVVLFGPGGGPVEGVLPGGGPALRFAKTHLAATPKTGVDEHRFFSAGEGFPVFDTPKARVGLLVCYDRRFPEGWRMLALQGAEVVFLVADVPAWAPSPSATAEEMFHIELRTRALENLFFVAACNKAGVERLGEVETRFFGRSCVVDPLGGLSAEAPPDEPMILRAALDLSQIAEGRSTLPYFEGRRPELYRLIAEKTPGPA
ncbi:MAG: carbon-nitrogen hydrolase family protein [Nitrospinota bacterium]|nr:carbon-nitrogen hydrolase family protein [Nitrospinota bacterium]MDP6482476.1 carbon-nitrogen hydrolase family protein [Nitrospinota bacterium]MDP6619436.1 carbon-nitrogen hydrolase family protein [Nitrospinota bacterium]HJM43361.1 carbon-nitrogen hydrolase family protein [Nitrospinota bacterium]